jgi:hypothetical protein
MIRVVLSATAVFHWHMSLGDPGATVISTSTPDEVVRQLLPGSSAPIETSWPRISPPGLVRVTMP